MSMTILPNIPEAQCIQVADDGPDGILLQYQRTAPTTRCPECASVTNRVQSHYRRTIHDLALHGLRVRVEIEVRRFRCLNAACDYQIFCERLGPWVPAYGRRSQALTAWIAQWGWHLSAEGLARVALDQGVRVSAPTILRILRADPDPVWEAPRIVGIDDWAVRKGHTYATVVVDLERHHIVDVLPDRQPGTVSQWLAQHPTIQGVSRDRARGYGKAITDGAPAAQQIADRWHLLKNLSDALQNFFTREPPRISARTAPDSRQATPDAATPTFQGVVHQEERYTAIRTLADAGYRVSAIARRTGYDRKTVTKYLTAGEPPRARSRAPYPHLLDAHVPLLERLWAEGTRAAPAVCAVLQKADYAGSVATVARWLRNRRLRDQAVQPTPPRRVTRRAWVAWFMVPSVVWPRQATGYAQCAPRVGAGLSPRLDAGPSISYHADPSPGSGPGRMDPGCRGEWGDRAGALCPGLDGRHGGSPGELDGVLESRHDGRLQQPNQVSQTGALWPGPF